MKPIRLAVFAASILFLATSPLRAEVPISSLASLQNMGYVMMDDITMSLLSHVETGSPYDLREVAGNRLGPHVPQPRDFGLIVNKAASQNEFERQEVAAVWGSFVAGRVQALKSARGYLIPMRVHWQQYDFSTHRFSAQFGLASDIWRSKSTFQCAGGYRDPGTRKNLMACMTATNLNAGAPSLQYFTIDDAGLARQVKDGYPIYFHVYAMAIPDGRYQSLQGKQMMWSLYENSVVAGIKPVKIINLALVNDHTGDIFAFAFPDVGMAPSEPPAPANIPPAAATRQRWRQYAVDEEGTHYVDLDSVRRDGDVVLIRDVTDITKVREDHVASRVGVLSFNCAKRTARGLGLKIYSEAKGQGEVVQERTGSEDLGSVQAGSLAEVVFNLACNAIPVAH